MRQRGPGSRIGWRAGILVCAVLATYANALDGPFIFDDTAAIVDNASIRDLGSPSVLAAEREVPSAGRPVVNVSFALNYAVAGLSVRGYHVTNILLHALCALAVFGLLLQTLTRPGFGPFVVSHAVDLAFAAALIWAVHPLNSEVVDYTTQRTESMMALFYLATMYAAIRAFDEKSGTRWMVAAVACCALGMACKESMVTAPVMVIIVDRTVLYRSFSDALSRRWRLYTAFAATWIVVIAATWSGPRLHSAGFSSGVTPFAYLLNQPGMIVQYLRLAIWPLGLVLDYGEPVTVPLSAALPAAVLVLSLLAATAWALATRPAYGFLGTWFFVTLAPTSSIIPIATEVGAERRMYLPLVAVVTLLVILAAGIGRFVLDRVLPLPVRARATTVLAACALMVVVVGLSARTIARNREYQSSLTMARSVVERWPTPVAHAMLGVELEVIGQHGEALMYLRQSAASGYSRAHYHLGGALFNHGSRRESIEQLQTFLAQSPMLAEAVKARMLLGRAYLDEHQWAQATDHLRQVVAMQPANDDAIGLLADSLFQQQRFAEAVSLYRQYVARRSGDTGALINLGVSYAGLGRAADAKTAFQMALLVDARDIRVHRNLAALALNSGDAESGERAAGQALAIDDRDVVARDLLGRALAMQGRLGEARAQFERALALDPSFEQARADLALVAR
jgi:tetratricopeptide (TPR) repeat protein